MIQFPKCVKFIFVIIFNLTAPSDGKSEHTFAKIQEAVSGEDDTSSRLRDRSNHNGGEGETLVYHAQYASSSYIFKIQERKIFFPTCVEF